MHMGYNIAKGYVHCYRCGHHRLRETVAELGGITLAKARQLLEGLETSAVRETIRPQGKLTLPKGLGPLLPAHARYLRRRGFDAAELVGLWGLQGIGLASRLAWRIFIPIHLDGQVVSWTTRATADDVEARYISARPEEEAVHHKDLLYGEQMASHAICVVEGPTGVWKIGPGAVATLGTGYTRAQFSRMAKYPVIRICFDPEPVAQQRAIQLAQDLASFGGDVQNLVLEDSEDPGALTDNELKKIRAALS